MNNVKKEQETREIVRAGYAAIALGQQQSCCGPPSCCCGSAASPDQLAEAIGYDRESLAVLPEGAKLHPGMDESRLQTLLDSIASI